MCGWILMAVALWALLPGRESARGKAERQEEALAQRQAMAEWCQREATRINPGRLGPDWLPPNPPPRS